MWVNFDRHDEGISSLKAFHDSLKALKDDPHYFKYCIIAVHNALQTYICIALRQGNSFNHWKKRDLEEWLKNYDDDQELSLPDLDNFLNLYKRLFDASDSRVYDQIRWLNEKRNTLIHFNIDSLSFTAEEGLNACSVAFQKIIESVSMAKGIVFYTDAQKMEFETITNNIRQALKQIG
jgi:hypothetical protein